MPHRSWSELLATEVPSTTLGVRILRTVIAVLFLAVGVALWVQVGALRHDGGNNKTELLDKGQQRLDKSVEEHVRTQTLICLAHPDRRHADPVFDDLCNDVIAQWGVIVKANGGG